MKKILTISIAVLLTSGLSFAQNMPERSNTNKKLDPSTCKKQNKKQTTPQVKMNDSVKKGREVETYYGYYKLAAGGSTLFMGQTYGQYIFRLQYDVTEKGINVNLEQSKEDRGSYKNYKSENTQFFTKRDFTAEKQPDGTVFVRIKWGYYQGPRDVPSMADFDINNKSIIAINKQGQSWVEEAGGDWCTDAKYSGLTKISDYSKN